MNDLRCDDVRELLSALLDEELSPEERIMALGHIERCAPCRAWLAQVHAAQQRLRAYPRIESARDLNDVVMVRVTAGPLTRLADALDRLICTPARQVAAAMVAALALSALVLSALVLFAALHVVTQCGRAALPERATARPAPQQAQGVAMLPEADIPRPPAGMMPRARVLPPEEIQRRLEETLRRDYSAK